MGLGSANLGLDSNIDALPEFAWGVQSPIGDVELDPTLMQSLQILLRLL